MKHWDAPVKENIQQQVDVMQSNARCFFLFVIDTTVCQLFINFNNYYTDIVTFNVVEP